MPEEALFSYFSLQIFRYISPKNTRLYDFFLSLSRVLTKNIIPSLVSAVENGLKNRFTKIHILWLLLSVERKYKSLSDSDKISERCNL